MCKTCNKEPDNCLECNTNLFFYENQNNKCLDMPNMASISNYILLDPQTYIKCDISCNSCVDTNKKCINCNTGYFKVDGDNKNYCYLPGEIIHQFGTNYYLDTSTSKYLKCDDSCSQCTGPNSNQCKKCSKGYYFIGGECKLKSVIENINTNYFLPLGGDTFYQCNTNCKTCNYNNDYCTSCDSGKSLFEDDHKCYNDGSKIGYYSYNNGIIKVFKKCDISCKKCSELSNKCIECAPSYFFVGDSSNGNVLIKREKKKMSNIQIII